MARDGSGNYTSPYPDFVAGTTISSSQVDANNSDAATALTQSIAVDGQSTVTGNIPMSTKKFTGLGAGSAATDSINLGQAQAGAYTYQGTDSGAADAYVIALVPAITTQAAGLKVAFVAANASTGASTLNAGGGADAIEYQGSALTGAEIAAGSTIVCEHDGTAWQMTSPSALLTSGGITASSTDTLTNKTIDANGTGNSISNIDVADLSNGTDGELITWDAVGAPAVVAVGTATHVLTSGGVGVAPTFQAASAGNLVQVVNTQDGALATGTTLIPLDDTIPQNTEGDEYMTLAITPTSATNKLKIEANIGVLSSSISDQPMTQALFQDTTAGALAASTIFTDSTSANRAQGGHTLVHYMTAGTTSATTFKIRIGGVGAGTTTFNGRTAARVYGGVAASSITITEILV